MSVGEQQLAALTSRERGGLALIAAGLTNQEICDRLWLSIPTIKTHVGNLIANPPSARLREAWGM